MDFFENLKISETILNNGVYRLSWISNLELK